MSETLRGFIFCFIGGMVILFPFALPTLPWWVAVLYTSAAAAFLQWIEPFSHWVGGAEE